MCVCVRGRVFLYTRRMCLILLPHKLRGKIESGRAKYAHGQGYDENTEETQNATRIEVFLRQEMKVELAEPTAESS